MKLESAITEFAALHSVVQRMIQFQRTKSSIKLSNIFSRMT